MRKPLSSLAIGLLLIAVTILNLSFWSEAALAANWPNEPTGATVITDYAFSDAIPCCGNGLTVGNGWAINNFGNATKVTDTTAPLSSSNILQMKYPIGFSSAGVGPANMYHSVGAHNQVFVGYWWKISNPWQGHDSSFNKISFLLGAQTINSIMMAGPPAGPFRMVYYLPANPTPVVNNCHLANKASADCPGSVTLNGNRAAVSLGVWHRIELYKKYSTTPTSQDGVIKMWIDGTVAMDYTTVNDQSAGDGSLEFQFAPTWGGNGGANKTENDFFWWDHVHLSHGGTLTGGLSDTTPPTVPTNLSAVAASSSQINLTWTASTDNVGVTGYRVERCQGAGCSSFAQITIPSGTSYSNTGLSASTSYRYRVRATDSAGNLSNYSTTASATTPATSSDTTPPPLPGTPSLSLSSTNTTGVTYSVSWNASMDQPSNTAVPTYTYLAGYNDGQAITQGTVFTNSATYSIPFHTSNTAQPGFFCVTAVDAAGNSSPAAACNAFTVPAKLDALPPTVPTNLSALAASSSQINLTWTASIDNVGVTGYRVERCQGSGCSSFAQIAIPSGTSYSNTGLSASTSYSYRVRATDAAANLSGYSSTRSATTAVGGSDTTPPPLPGSPSLSLSSTNTTSATYSVSWTASIDQPSNTAVPSYTYTAGYNDGQALTQGTVFTNSTTYSIPYHTSGTAQSGFFCVTAVDAAGNRSPDAACNAFTVPAKAALPPDTTPPPLPGTPSLSLSSTNTTGVTYSVSWNASIDQPSNTAVPSYTYTAGYNDGQALTQGTVFTNSATYSIPFHTSNTAQPGFFCVTAVDAAGNSSPTAACNAFTVPAPSAPSAPTNLGLR